jgi:hypothetical protein
MLVSVVETDAYLSKADKIMSAEERDFVVSMISARPTIGDVIPGTGGLRKVRIPLQGRGKRGGGRVIYWYYNAGYPAVLVWPLLRTKRQICLRRKRNHWWQRRKCSPRSSGA